jgi:hypothetical protein
MPGDEVDALRLQALKGLLPHIGSSLLELLDGELAGPVSLDSLLHLTVGACVLVIRLDG